MDEIKETGGARIGMANATWPLATLTVNAAKLELNASIVGNLTFKPSDVTSITPYVIIPFLGQGIQIHHTIAAYNAKVIFWTMGSPEALIARIAQTGFLNNTSSTPGAHDAEIAMAQSGGGFPMKKPAAITIVVIWNLLFFAAFAKFFTGIGLEFRINILIAVALVFLTALLTLINEPFRKLVLKPGRTINDVKTGLFFIMFITGMLFIGISLMRFP